MAQEEFAVRVWMGDDIVRRYYVVAENDDEAMDIAYKFAQSDLLFVDTVPSHEGMADDHLSRHSVTNA